MALFTLAVFSAGAGVVILWAFKVTSNQRALEVARRRLRAHLLAMRLFGDDPPMILRSQGRLLLWTARYMALLLPPFLVMAIPLFFAWDHLDAVWGHAPFAPGDTTVVTARTRGPAPPGVQLVVPDWMVVESPAVRVSVSDPEHLNGKSAVDSNPPEPGRQWPIWPAESRLQAGVPARQLRWIYVTKQGDRRLVDYEVSWRVRVRQTGSGDVSVRLGGESAEKRVEARPGLHYLADRTKARGGEIEWVEVRYPAARLALLGLSANWVVWFCFISTLTALVLRSKMRVTF